MSESIQGCYLPANLPPLSVILMDYLDPSARRLARYFGVSPSTAHRWLKQDRAPRAVLAALYLAAPRFGAVDAYNRVLRAETVQAIHRQYAEGLKRENAALRHELARLVRLGDFGSANDPLATDQRHLRPIATTTQARRPKEIASSIIRNSTFQGR